MTRVTISLPDPLTEVLRQKANAEGKSLSAWLRERLTREVEAGSDWVDEIRRISDKAALLAVPDTDWKWNREEIYEERLNRG